MVKKEIIKTVREYRKAIEEQGINVAKIVLYGSYASGKSHKDSDIDVAVVSPDFGKNRHKEGVKLLQIAYNVDLRIEPIPFSVKSYENDDWVPLIYEIKEHGVVIQ